MPRRWPLEHLCTRRSWFVGAGFAIAAALGSHSTPQAGPQSAPSFSFDWVNRHIVVKASVNNSPPLSFVLDTGARDAMIKLDRAKQLGLRLGREARFGGAGAGIVKGAVVENATLTITGVPALSIPVKLALPLENLGSSLGLEIDGILGGEFTRDFVVEVDYERSRITLHDRSAFRYSGPGEAIPIGFNRDGHPVLKADVTPVGRSPVTGEFMLDTGSGAALILHSPFVSQHRLPSPGMKTVRATGLGAGGAVQGDIGRVAQLRIGGYTLDSPLTLFSQDKAGAFADPALAGNIGSQIIRRFKLFLDYSGSRVILEPTAELRAPFERAFSGVAIRAEGSDYRTYRIRQVVPDSPGADAGLQAGDVIETIDRKPASGLTLTNVLEMFERPASYELTVRRGEQLLTLTLKPRRID
jgi:hypothetical protein